MTERYVICQITSRKIPLSDAQPIGVIRTNLLHLIKKKYPKIDVNGFISKSALKDFREQYISDLIKTERGEISKLDREVISSMVEHETLAKNINKQFEKKLTFGEKLSDKMATFGGSWRFIIIFGCVMFAWILINIYILAQRPFDAYPFILLNLCLSCLAALQAPVIMMSQNRKDAKDRMRAENDYKVNLKAELEIRTLHEKLDNLIQHQWQRLLEIQQMQLETMEEVQSRGRVRVSRRRKRKK